MVKLTVHKSFKLNDHYAAFYADLIMKREPDIPEGFFRRRKSTDKYHDEAKAFHEANPWVYARLVETARHWIDLGYKHGSIRDALARARWEPAP